MSEFNGKKIKNVGVETIPWEIAMTFLLVLSHVLFRRNIDCLEEPSLSILAIVLIVQLTLYLLTMSRLFFYRIQKLYLTIKTKEIRKKLFIDKLPEGIDLGEYFQRRKEAIENFEDLEVLKKIYQDR